MAMNLWIIAFIVALISLIAALIRIRFLAVKVRNAKTERARLFRRSSEFLLVLDDNLVVLDISTSILRNFHLDATNTLGQHIDKTMIWPDSEQSRTRALHSFRKALAGEVSVFSYNRPDNAGREFSLKIKVFPVPSDFAGRQNLFCVGRDITSEIGTKLKLSRRVRVEDIIAKISSAALSAAELKECVPGIMESAGVFLAARRAFCFQTDRNKNILWGSMWGAPGTPDISTGLKGLNVESMMPFGIGGGFVTIKDIPNNDLIGESARNQAQIAGMRSLILNSLTGPDGAILGFAGFTFDIPEPPDDESSALLLKLLSTTLTGLLSRIDARKNLELFRQSVEAAGQGIVLIDTDGRVEYANSAYYRLTGRNADSAEPVWSAYTDSFSEKVKLLILPLVNSGEHWAGELQIRKNHGETVDTIESFHPIETGGGKPQFIVNIVTEISDQKRLESQLILARKEAEQANRAKSNYLANMSHEIRTPMNAVIGLTYLALQTGLDNRQMDYLQKINASAKNLLAIINDILDLSKIESGRLELEATEFSLDEVLDNLADMVVDKAWEKDLTLLFSRAPNIQDSRIGDRFRLGQVLLNLVGNAIKFTEEGSVTLQIETETENPEFLTFIVEDSGIGMTKEQIGRLFTPFSQAEASTSRKYGGTGLGLTISGEIAELMDGSIEVKSQPGRGSRFTTRLQIPQGAFVEESPGSERAITIVSGDTATGKFLRQIFKSLSMEITFCRSIKEALEDSAIPSIILFDVDVYSDNPAAAIHALCTDTPEDFLLILSGSRNAEELSRLVPAGVRNVSIPLPFSRSRLLKILSNPGETKEKTRAGSLTIGGRVLLADDNQINQQVGKELISRVGLTVDVAGNGLEAISALESHLYDLILMDLHMPEMDGYEAAAIIRQDYPDLPIVAMTASALNDVKSGVMNAGFSSYIAKPIEPDELYRLIGEILAIPDSALRPNELTRKNSYDAMWNVEGLDTKIGLRGVLGDQERYLQILQLFAADHQNIQSGIRNAINLENQSEAISLIHTLRGSAGQIGAVDLQQKSGLMEEMLREGGRTDTAALADFFSALDRLLVDIDTLGRSVGTPGGSKLFDELENLIRNSDLNAKEFLDEHFSGSNGKRETVFIEKIRSALSRRDYDLALEIAEDWRTAAVELIE